MSQADRDADDLKKLGYAQELLREMGAFSNSALSFSSSVPHLTQVQTLQLWRTMRRGGVAAYLYGHLHDDFAAREVEGITFAKAPAADDGGFYVVTTDGHDVQLEACIVDSCVPARPVVAPGTDPPPPEIIR